MSIEHSLKTHSLMLLFGNRSVHLTAATVLRKGASIECVRAEPLRWVCPKVGVIREVEYIQKCRSDSMVDTGGGVTKPKNFAGVIDGSNCEDCKICV